MALLLDVAGRRRRLSASMAAHAAGRDQPCSQSRAHGGGHSTSACDASASRGSASRDLSPLTRAPLSSAPSASRTRTQPRQGHAQHVLCSSSLQRKRCPSAPTKPCHPAAAPASHALAAGTAQARNIRRPQQQPGDPRLPRSAKQHAAAPTALAIPSAVTQSHPESRPRRGCHPPASIARWLASSTACLGGSSHGSWRDWPGPSPPRRAAAQ